MAIWLFGRFAELCFSRTLDSLCNRCRVREALICEADHQKQSACLAGVAWVMFVFATVFVKTSLVKRLWVEQ